MSVPSPAMGRHMQLGELLVGVEGLALLRRLYDGTDEDAACRLAEVARIVNDNAFSAAVLTSEADPQSGYGSWSERYDEPGNPIIAIEEPVVWSLLNAVPVGRALDAACGTGRHARQLVELGHQVVGIDLTPEMLSRARGSVAGATFLKANLCDIPQSDGQFDLVVCGLALAHIAELDGAMAELSRVLGPRGRLVVSVLHPFQAHLGWHAPLRRRARSASFRARAPPQPCRLSRSVSIGRPTRARLHRTGTHRERSAGQAACLPSRSRRHDGRLHRASRRSRLGGREALTLGTTSEPSLKAATQDAYRNRAQSTAHGRRT